jgi:hypothetical protein
VGSAGQQERTRERAVGADRRGPPGSERDQVRARGDRRRQVNPIGQ